MRPGEEIVARVDGREKRSQTDGSPTVAGRARVAAPVALAAGVLALALAIDAAFIALDVLFGASDSFPDRMRLERERGVPEFFQYGKWILAAALMWRARHVASLYGVWAATFVVLLFDDALSLHERFGLAMAPYSPAEPFGLDIESYVLPQLVLQSVMGLILLTVLVVVGRRTRDVGAVRFSMIGLVLLALLAGFAVGGDFLLDLITDRGSNREAQLFEEGGELLIGTLLLGHVLLEAARLRSRSVTTGLMPGTGSPVA